MRLDLKGKEQHCSLLGCQEGWYHSTKQTIEKEKQVSEGDKVLECEHALEGVCRDFKCDWVHE